MSNLTVYSKKTLLFDILDVKIIHNLYWQAPLYGITPDVTQLCQTMHTSKKNCKLENIFHLFFCEQPIYAESEFMFCKHVTTVEIVFQAFFALVNDHL